MNDWKKPGPHNCYEAHDVDRQADLPQSLRDPFRKMKRCPGGSPVTAADLEGEKVWWCLMHRAPGDEWQCWPQGVYPQSGDCQMVEWLLVPIPDPQPATEWGPDHPSYNEMGQ